MIEKTPDVSVLVVSYNGKDLLERCLRSVFEATEGIDFEVVISDNGSCDGTIEIVEKLFPAVKLIKNAENLGFSRANNVALPYCRGRHILLLNPDAMVISGALQKMISAMDSRPNVGAMGAKLINPDGSLQLSVRNFPTLLSQFAESLFLHQLFPRASRFSEVVRDPKTYDRVHEVDWVSGAVLMIRRAALDDVGPLDARFFMYSEETDWCFRARRKGWKIYFFPYARFIHVHGQSSTNPALYARLIKSKVGFIKKHRSPLEGLLFVFSMWVGLGLRVGLWFAVSLANCFRNEASVNKLRVSWAGLIGLMGYRTDSP